LHAAPIVAELKVAQCRLREGGCGGVPGLDCRRFGIRAALQPRAANTMLPLRRSCAPLPFREAGC
jgi:hypothetical protein